MKINKFRDSVYNFNVGDIVTVKDSHLDNAELEIIKMVENGYAGQVIFKVINPAPKNQEKHLRYGQTLKKDEILSTYGLGILNYATLLKQGTGKASTTYKRKSNIDKYTLEVEDFGKMMLGIDIGITIWNNDDHAMSDQDPCDELPELEQLNLGEIQISEDGFVGLSTDLSVEEIKEILRDNGFSINNI